MAIDVTVFHKINTVDTCAIWNILSSARIFSAAIRAKCTLSCTRFVLYECLYKPRSNPALHERELQQKLKKARRDGHFADYDITIEDLQSVEVLRNRMNLAKGEISSIVFAKKTSQAFLTDDQGARKLAKAILPNHLVQTTPHLFGWLLFCGELSDSDKDIAIREHEKANRPLAKYLNEAYRIAMEMKLAHRHS